jgi:hypothetical protein
MRGDDCDRAFVAAAGRSRNNLQQGHLKRSERVPRLDILLAIGEGLKRTDTMATRKSGEAGLILCPVKSINLETGDHSDQYTRTNHRRHHNKNHNLDHRTLRTQNSAQQ